MHRIGYSVQVVATAVLVGAVLALSGCSSAGSSSVEVAQAELRASRQPTVSEGLKRENTLTVGLRSSSSAPFVVGSLQNPRGLDVELGRALADAMSLDVAFVEVNGTADALANSCDVVMGTAEASAEGAEVGGIYASSAVGLFAKGGDGVVSADQVVGKKVGLQEGSSAQELLFVRGIEVEQQPYATINDAFDALDAGEVDYVVCHVTSGAYLAQRRQDVSFVGSIGVATPEGVAFAGGESELADAVRTACEQVAGNGVLQETRRRWVGGLPLLGEQDQIANLPEPENTGEDAEAQEGTYESYGAEEVGAPTLDGSNAGANAAVPVDTGASNQGYGYGYGYTYYDPYAYNPYAWY